MNARMTSMNQCFES